MSLITKLKTRATRKQELSDMGPGIKNPPKEA